MEFPLKQISKCDLGVFTSALTNQRSIYLLQIGILTNWNFRGPKGHLEILAPIGGLTRFAWKFCRQTDRHASFLKEMSIFKITQVSAMDAGKYECQVSTVPKISRLMDLVVVVPKVGIQAKRHKSF